MRGTEGDAAIQLGAGGFRLLHCVRNDGSVVALTKGDGSVLAINSYDEYGIPAQTNLGRFQYTGQTWLPELAMYYYKARIYSPRWAGFCKQTQSAMATA